MTQFDIVPVLEEFNDEGLSHKEILRRNFLMSYKAWNSAIKAEMRLSNIIAYWDKYVVARDRYLDFRFN